VRGGEYCEQSESEVVARLRTALEARACKSNSNRRGKATVQATVCTVRINQGYTVLTVLYRTGSRTTTCYGKGTKCRRDTVHSSTLTDTVLHCIHCTVLCCAVLCCDALWCTVQELYSLLM